MEYKLLAFKEHTCPKHLRDHQDGRDPSTKKRSPVAFPIGHNVVIVILTDAQEK